MTRPGVLPRAGRAPKERPLAAVSDVARGATSEASDHRSVSGPHGVSPLPVTRRRRDVRPVHMPSSAVAWTSTRALAVARPILDAEENQHVG